MIAARAVGRCVLVVTHHFPPSSEVGAQASAQIARHLPRYGWQPVVLTVREADLEELDRSARLAFEGPVIRTRLMPHPLRFYKSLKTRMMRDANENPDAEASPHRGSIARRWLLSLLMTPDPYTSWIPPAILRGLALVRRFDVDHLFSSAPCWTNHLVGLGLSWLTGIPWTAHFRDPWTSWGPASTFSAWGNRRLERMVVRRAVAVVCVTDRQTADLRRAHSDLPTDKFKTIANGFDGQEWEDLGVEESRPARADSGAFIITYAGTIYQARDPLPVFRALRGLIESGEVARDRIRVELVGWWSPPHARSLRATATACGVGDCVDVIGPFTRADALRKMTDSTLLLLLAEELTLQIPQKTYEYLRAGRPILALTSEGALADLLRSVGGARVVDPSDVGGIASAIQQDYRRWREGRELSLPDPSAVARFDRRLLAGRFAEIFDRSVRPASLPRS